MIAFPSGMGAGFRLGRPDFPPDSLGSRLGTSARCPDAPSSAWYSDITITALFFGRRCTHAGRAAEVSEEPSGEQGDRRDAP